MIYFQLFRIQIIEPAQANLFSSKMSRREVLERLVKSEARMEKKAGKLWLLSKPEVVDEDAWFFNLGRQKVTKISLYDQQDHSFFTHEVSNATPFTSVFVDVKLQVVAISPNSALATKTPLLSHFLEEMFNEYLSKDIEKLSVKISPLKDPKGFIEKLNSAYEVTKFSFSTGQPNPAEDSEIRNQLKGLNKAINARKGSVVVEGLEMDRKKLAKIAESSASLGDEVTAMVRFSSADKAARKLDMEDAEVGAEALRIDDISGRKDFVTRMRQAAQAVGVTVANAVKKRLRRSSRSKPPQISVDTVVEKKAKELPPISVDSSLDEGIEKQDEVLAERPKGDSDSGENQT